MIKQTKSIIAWTALSMIGAAPGMLAQIPDPLVRFNFSGGSLNNTGTLSGTATLVPGSETTPVITEYAPGRFAYDARHATGMGYDAVSGDNGWLAFDAQGGLNGLLSFTITGWYYTGEGVIIDNNAYLYDAPGAFRVNATNAGDRQQVGLEYPEGAPLPTAGNSGPQRDWLQDSEDWIFFSVAYDGTADTAQLQIINAKSQDFLVRQNRNITLDDEPVIPGFLGDIEDMLLIGNNSVASRPFQGMLRDLRIYGSMTDGSGYISQADVTQHIIPEPSVYAGIAGAAVFFVALLSRRRR